LKDFKHRFSDFRTGEGDTRSYDDTLVMYCIFLVEQFDSEILLNVCRKYIFELRFYYLQINKMFKHLSDESQMLICRYGIKRAISVGRCDSDVVKCIDKLAELKSHRCSCAPSKRKKMDDIKIFIKMVVNPLRDFAWGEEEIGYTMNEPNTYLFLKDDNIDHDDVKNKNIFPQDDISNIIISVEDQELHLNKDVLRLLSPVFKTMLNNNSDDTKINLPDKKADDVILFFSFFYPDRKIPFKDKFDYFALLKLCEEYKTEWLKEKIQNYLYWRVATFINKVIYQLF